MVARTSKFFFLVKVINTHPIIVRSLEIIVRDLGYHLDLRPEEGEKLGRINYQFLEIMPIG